MPPVRKPHSPIIQQIPVCLSLPRPSRYHRLGRPAPRPILLASVLGLSQADVDNDAAAWPWLADSSGSSSALPWLADPSGNSSTVIALPWLSTAPNGDGWPEDWQPVPWLSDDENTGWGSDGGNGSWGLGFLFKSKLCLKRKTSRTRERVASMSLVSEEMRRNLDGTILRIIRLVNQASWQVRGETVCACGQQAIFRCVTCTLAFVPNMCCACMVDAHAGHPFHELLEWDNDIELFTRTTLRDMGLRVGFGHDGATCSRPPPGRLKALTLNGVLQVSVDYCTCPGAPGRADQIKAHGWWPMWSNFCSALPQDVLDQYCEVGEFDTQEPR